MNGGKKNVKIRLASRERKVFAQQLAVQAREKLGRQADLCFCLYLMQGHCVSVGTQDGHTACHVHAAYRCEAITLHNLVDQRASSAKWYADTVYSYIHLRYRTHLPAAMQLQDHLAACVQQACHTSTTQHHSSI